MIHSFLNSLKCANRRLKDVLPFTRRISRNPIDLVHGHRYWITHWGDNPTVDYYFRSKSKNQFPNSQFIDISAAQWLPKPPADAIIVVVRYLSEALVTLLKTHKSQGGKIVFFMDDDLPENMCNPKLPHGYRSLLWTRFGDYLPDIEELCDELWVSTPALCRRYAHANPREVNPAYIHPSKSEPTFYFYHGSPSTHKQDIEWLRAVVEDTQKNSENLIFMIIGDRQVKRLFSDLPRTLIMHSMPWQTYRDVLPSFPHHIGLAPLLPTKCNTTRGPTRFYDITRLGAVGIYSDIEPYRGFVNHGVDGCLLTNDPAAWSNQILELAKQPHARQLMLENARSRDHSSS